ncbi:protein transport protein Sec31A isoform X2 [Cylas formicarius]|uniref:protein transport protein Sec31A isoform X2 n=1 Tax=Cylas formicarius TaxID=197179 RepID=UPI00295850C6|nr:protein transport protein Sec31A isoform X2 [Cylas formicarius]
MKVKDIERTANVAWSPKHHQPIYLAAGTAAQQLDASFSTNAALEIYSLNLTEPGPDTQLISSVPSEHRFHKIIWGPSGTESNGIIIGGCEDGLMQIYNASKMLKSENSLMVKQQKHTGPVHALDFNNFQQNLFASGAGDSEIFIWDINNTTTPMTPGAKSQPFEDVLSVAWNKQVQHILASSFASKCVIWDLRKNEQIIKLTDTVSRIRWKMVTWHPEVATQLCLASEEDHSPVIQVWDLRFATSPLKTLENHQRGVLAVSWCTDDADLLVSCGKDNRIICWNPNSNHQNGEILSEIARTNQWSFDVVWCPRNPALIACPNFDGHVSVYSIMGGKTQQVQTTNKIADSFPGMDGYVQAPVQTTPAVISVDLSKPPKWLKRPVGASFGFGGKLITFENDKEKITLAQQTTQPGQGSPHISRIVQISQVITEPEFIQKSSELEQALESGNFIEYCLNKSESSNDQHRKYIWHFLKANFDSNPRAEFLNLLGYRIDDVNAKLNEHIGESLLQKGDIIDHLANGRIDDFDLLQDSNQKNNIPFKIKTTDDTDGLITQALLLNNVEAAVELCLKAKRYADALIIATTGGPDLLARTQHQYLENSEGYISNLISAIVSEDWGSIVNNCDISSWKEALAAILTHASDDHLPILCEQLGMRLENEIDINPKLGQDAQLCYICSGNFDRLVSSWSDGDFSSTETLQELVELVSFLQKSIERQGKRVQISDGLADVLSRYSALLASQGDLSTALSYLGSSQNEKMASLRDRLLTALGQKPLNIQELRQQQGNRRSSTRTSFSNYGGPSQNTIQQFVPPQPVPPTNNAFPYAFNTGLPNPTVSSQPWQTQPTPVSNYSSQPPPKTFSPPLSQPPRPTSVGSSHGGSAGLPTRKYVLDPSVTSNQYYNRNQFSSQPVPTFDGSYGAYPTNPHNSNYGGQPISTQLYQPSTSSAAVPNPPLNPVPLATAPQYGTQPPIEAALSAGNSYHGQSAPGWNDPPVLNRLSRQQKGMSPMHAGTRLWRKSKPDSTPSEPITHPIFGTAPPQPTPAPNGYTYGEVTSLPQPYNPSAPVARPHQQPQMLNLPTMSAPPPAGFPNPNSFNQNAISGLPSAPRVQDINVKPEVPEVVQKPPIPDEHIHLQKVLDELKHRCGSAANNPQTRRKLDDVGKRLDTLYDCLRYNQLSSNALGALHQIVKLIESGDYANGLHLHTQLVQGPDFAQIAGFMPGLKVLLQCALQLHVYLN